MRSAIFITFAIACLFGTISAAPAPQGLTDSVTGATGLTGTTGLPGTEAIGGLTSKGSPVDTATAAVGGLAAAGNPVGAVSGLTKGGLPTEGLVDGLPTGSITKGLPTGTLLGGGEEEKKEEKPAPPAKEPTPNAPGKNTPKTQTTTNNVTQDEARR